MNSPFFIINPGRDSFSSDRLELVCARDELFRADRTLMATTTSAWSERGFRLTESGTLQYWESPNGSGEARQ